MALKPSENTILSTYTLDELIELIREKAQMEVEQKLNEAKNQLVALIGEGTTDSAPSTYTPTPGRGRRKSTTKTKAKKKSTAKQARGSKQSLGNYILEAVGSKPMSIREIMNSIKSLGYKSKAKDPRRILYLELKKQVEKGNIKKTGRGMYTQG